ncbi:response regulator [Pontiella agarivorans]|uniref:histidine kinase n=1 Tax=Pontiella agarivorans TaxID=3038953 RepID=A0ABU5MT76_9BACT|nr:response regulator [Pontiella agarivorans]MDZ8117404.1 response regulator [Pontiella agarivorans]
MSVVVIAGLIFAMVLLSISLLANVRFRARAKEAEQRYAKSRDRVLQLFEQSSDAILIAEKDGRLKAANRKAVELLQTNLKTLTARRIQDIVSDKDQEEFVEKLSEWFSGRTVRWEAAVKSEAFRTLDVEFVPCLQQVNGIRHLEIHVCDIRARKEAENKIHAARQMAEDALEMAHSARREAEQSSQRKSEFMAAMSRDLRTPLNNIVGAGQLLNEELPIEDQKEYLQIIQDSSQRLQQVIDHVLDIAKIEAGQMETLSGSLDIRDICRELEERFRRDSTQKGLYLECACKENVPEFLIGDRGMLEHVLENLLANAFAFTESGSICLRVECRSVNESGASVYFEVKDSGIGIPSEKQQWIFEKFVYTSEFAKAQPDDAALGLAISKRQVELMGGILGVHSETGQGTTFYFNLMLPVATPSGLMDRPKRESLNRVRCDNMSILLAEDNRLNRKVAEDLLTKAGCRVDSVENGRDAALQVRKAEYDAVLMDCEMPVMDGFESTKKIRKMPEPYRSIPIIALTANAMKEDIEKCTAAGMTAYLSKPISRKHLIEVLNLHVQQV